MDFEIRLSYSVEGSSMDTDCDDEDLDSVLKDDEEFQGLLEDLLARFARIAAEYDDP